MKTTVILALKDLRLLLRDRMGLFWILAFPVLMALFFGAIFGGSPSGTTPALPVAVVDEDGSEASGSFVARLQKSESLKVELSSREKARESVRLGRRAAYVVIKKGFSESSGLSPGGSPTLEVGIDPSRKAEGGYLQGILTQIWFQGLQEQFRDPTRMRGQVDKALDDIEGRNALPPDQRKLLGDFLKDLDGFLGQVDPDVLSHAPRLESAGIEEVAVETEHSGPRSAFEVSFPQAILWGLLGCAAAFGISVVHERVHGTFLRLRIAPLSRGQILGGKGMACFLSCNAVILFLLIFGRLACGVRLQNPLALAIPCSAACFVGIMMFVSVLGKTEHSVAGAGWGILTIFSMLGGGMVPLFIMPGWMKTLSHVSPVKWSILALEGAIWRDFSIEEMMLPCGALLGFGALFLALSLVRFARMDRA